MLIKPSPGPVIFKEQGDANEFCLISTDHRWLFAFRQNGELTVEKQRANGELIAEAFNVLHDTGLTPRELEAGYAEARSMLFGAEQAERSLAKENDALRAHRDELLAALKDIEGFLKRSGYDTQLVRATIAKAEGGAA